MVQLYQKEGPVDGATQHRARSAPCSESFLGRKCLTPALSTRHQMLRVLANILRTPAPRKATTCIRAATTCNRTATTRTRSGTTCTRSATIRTTTATSPLQLGTCPFHLLLPHSYFSLPVTSPFQYTVVPSPLH